MQGNDAAHVECGGVVIDVAANRQVRDVAVRECPAELLDEAAITASAPGIAHRFVHHRFEQGLMMAAM
jgi:hypothetical protein